VPDLKKLIYNKYNPVVSIFPVNFLIKITKQNLILPCYHIISDDYRAHITNLYKYKNVKSFRSDLDFLLRYYKPVDLSGLIEMIKNNAKPDSKLFFLSFDDGLREFYDVISPILLEKGIPATCFLNSAFIDNKDIFFRYKASILIEFLNKANRKSEEWKIIKNWFSDNHMSIENYKPELLKIKYDNKSRLDELANVLDYNFKDYLEREKPYLTTQQINELINKGFTFGAHSVDHPEYRYIPYSDQVKQTKESVEMITGKFKLNYRAFAFPFTDFGLSRKFFQEINRDISLDLTVGCAGIKHDSIKNNLQRIPMDEYNLKAGNRIKNDYFYYLIKSIFQKNKIIRK